MTDNKKKPEDEIFDLPPPAEQVVTDPIMRKRTCPKCGQEPRIISNYDGVSAYCNHCKYQWGVSGPRVPIEARAAFLPRGITKTTLVPMDPSIAFEDDEGDFNANRRWKERK
jgi:hypothetical protein